MEQEPVAVMLSGELDAGDSSFTEELLSPIDDGSRHVRPPSSAATSTRWRRRAPDGVFSIGDGSGKGVEAGVLTGQIRQSLGTVALVSPGPAERLRLLNSAMLRADGISFVTLLHGVLQRGDGYVEVRMGGRWSSATPPPP